jgi:hypothetical protein
LAIKKEVELDLAPSSDLPTFALAPTPEESHSPDVPVSAAFDLGSDPTPESEQKLETTPPVKPVRSTG